MDQPDARPLRGHDRDLLDPVDANEAITLLLERWRQLPDVDPAAVRADIDHVIDPTV